MQIWLDRFAIWHEIIANLSVRDLERDQLGRQMNWVTKGTAQVHSFRWECSNTIQGN